MAVITIVVALVTMATATSSTEVMADDEGRACDRTVKTDGNLQETIDGLPGDATPQVVCLVPGEHRIAHRITVERSHVTLRGAADGAVLRMQAGVSSPVIVIGDAAHQTPSFRISDVTVERLRIVGGGDSDREFSPELPYLSNSAVIVRSGDRVRLRDLDVSACRSACLLTEYDSRNILIQGNAISQALWDGISLNRAGPTRVIDNIIRENTAAGITVEHLHDGEIAGNRIEGNGSHGVYLADAVDNVFRDNAFVGNHLAGVYLTCSVRYRDPVRCWPNSMSRKNVFESNRFDDNRFGYQIGVDGAANCRDHEGPMNVSRGDVFEDTRHEHPAPEVYGDCLDYANSRWS